MEEHGTNEIPPRPEYIPISPCENERWIAGAKRSTQQACGEMPDVRKRTRSTHSPQRPKVHAPPNLRGKLSKLEIALLAVSLGTLLSASLTLLLLDDVAY